MDSTIQFGERTRQPAPARWGCINLLATPILSDPLVVEHHYEPHGSMREHAGSEAILCVCVEGQGFVRVGDQTSDLKANEAVVWPAQKMHQVWTEDSAMTILLIHFPGRSDLTPRDPSRL